MKRLSLLVLSMLVSVSGFAAEQPLIQSLLGREFVVQDDWAGQELTFIKKGDTICAVWRILGSGVPVVSEVEYPVEVRSPRQCRFEVKLRDESPGKIMINLCEDSKVCAYLNGVKIHLDEKMPNSPGPSSSNRGGSS